MELSPIDVRNYVVKTNESMCIPSVLGGKAPKAKAHSNALATAAAILMEQNLLFEKKLSVDWLASNVAEETPLEYFKVAEYMGAVEQKDFPFQNPDMVIEFKDELYSKSSKFSNYCLFEQSDDIKLFIQKSQQPVLVIVDWFDDTEVRNGTIRSRKKGKWEIKPLLIYGWTERGWKVLNPNEPNWGENGCAILPFYIPIYEAWGYMPAYLEADGMFKIKRPFSNKIGNFFAKIFNFVANALGF